MPTGPSGPLSSCPPNQLFHSCLDILKAGGLRRLIKAPLMPLLLHHCIICGQWHERPHMIKMHFRCLHPEFYNSSEGATQLAARTGGAFSPCLYCAQTRAHPRQHLHTCIALWQACVLHLYSGDGHEPGGRSDGSVLRTGPGKQDGGTGLDGRGGCGEGDKIRETQCGRQGQRESEGRRSRRASTPTLRQRTRRTGPGGDGSPEAGGQNSCSSKRGVDGAQAKHRLDLVASHSGAVSHSGHDHRRSEVERGNREKGQQAQRPATSSGAVLDDDVFHQGNGGENGRRGDQDSQNLGLDDGGRAMGLPTLEPGDQVSGAGLDACSTEAGRAFASPNGHHPPDPSRDVVPLQAASYSGGEPSGSVGSSADGCGPSVPRSHHPLRESDQTPRQLLPADLGSLLPSGRLSQATQPGEVARTGVWMRTILSNLVLANPGNHCYMNASVRSLLWTLAGCAGHSTLDRHVSPLGAQAANALAPHKPDSRLQPILVHNLFPWRLLASGWQSPQQQHDCAEYIAHIIPRMCPECMKGEWSARVEVDGTVIDTEHAPTTQALSLEIPAGNVHRTQALIHHWHTQSSVHALRLPPEILLLRFVRYSLHVGGVLKNSATIEWVSIHVTRTTFRTQWRLPSCMLGRPSLPAITPPVYMPQAGLTTVMTVGLPDSRHW